MKDSSLLSGKRACLLIVFAVVWLVPACGGGGDPPVERVAQADRYWTFKTFLADGLPPVNATDPGHQLGGVVEGSHDYGPLRLVVRHDTHATGEVFSSATGGTYWVAAQAPSGSILTPASKIGNKVQLNQYQRYRKNAADATLKLKITRIFLEAIDANGQEILYPECPWSLDCELVISGEVDFEVQAWGNSGRMTGLNLFRGHSAAEIFGHQGNWRGKVRRVIDGAKPLWDLEDFEKDDDVDGSGFRQHAVFQLKKSLTVAIDLAKLDVGDEFTLRVVAHAQTNNRRQRESYVAAFFRDPVESEGTVIESVGLEPVALGSLDAPADAANDAPACATGSDPAAGVLQFSSAAFRAPELPHAHAEVVVTRTGGTRGAVSVTVATSDATALAGVDYVPVSRTVRFEDGDDAPQVVEVPLVVDQVAEPDEELHLTLSSPRGCAVLGAQASAVMTILDDDRAPPAAPTYSVGGTLRGLAGGSVVVADAVTGSELELKADGAFSFTYRYSDQQRYDVRVLAQPMHPDQVCGIVGGSGAVAAADVADVRIECTSPPQPSGLDTTFGVAGKVTTGLPGGGKAVAIQRDGKILVVGGLSLLRLRPDGSPDGGFGNAGTVPIVFDGSLIGNDARALVLQPDGRILVAGLARLSGTDQRMAVARFNADGSVDASFGSGGRVSVDPYQGVAKRAVRGTAEKLFVQPDGKIVAVGTASFVDTGGVGRGLNYAMLRLNADGSLDTGFGRMGVTTVDPGGDFDIAYGVAGQADGKLVLAGRGGSNTDVDVALARIRTDGSLDTDDPRRATNYGPDLSGFARINVTGWEEAADMLMLSDDRVVLAVQSLLGTHFGFTLMRVSPAGQLEKIVQTAIGPSNDYSRALAMQADGKLVVVGQVSSTTVSDFGIVRYGADLTVDPTFGTNGVLTIDFFGAADGANGVALQPDGKIVVVGVIRNGNRDDLGVVRIVP